VVVVGVAAWAFDVAAGVASLLGGWVGECIVLPVGGIRSMHSSRERFKRSRSGALDGKCATLCHGDL
jgi:hypothetical protein